MTQTPEQLRAQIVRAARLWLFLDYDGTLADFAPTPACAVSDPEVVAVLDRLAHCPALRLVILSGRRLSQVQQLVPIENVLLAGTYGIELQLPDGTLMQRVDQRVFRPTLERLKPAWEGLIANQTGFFLEDKGWSLALHARFASEQAAAETLKAADIIADKLVTSDELSIRQDQRFLEVSPVLAHKSCAVEFILERWAWPGALLVYVGDDAHDEAAFEVIKNRGGLALLVAPNPQLTKADAVLVSPEQTRVWLNALANDYQSKTDAAHWPTASSWQVA